MSGDDKLVYRLQGHHDSLLHLAGYCFDRRGCGPTSNTAAAGVPGAPRGHRKKLIRVVENGTIRNLTGQDYNRPERAASQRCARRLTAERTRQLVSDYQSGAGSIYTLAEKYKVHRHTISAALKGHGIALGRTSMSDTEVERARTLQAQGLSWNAIGKTIRRDPKTVKAACTSATLVESETS